MLDSMLQYNEGSYLQVWMGGVNMIPSETSSRWMRAAWPCCSALWRNLVEVKVANLDWVKTGDGACAVDPAGIKQYRRQPLEGLREPPVGVTFNPVPVSTLPQWAGCGHSSLDLIPHGLETLLKCSVEQISHHCIGGNDISCFKKSLSDAPLPLQGVLSRAGVCVCVCASPGWTWSTEILWPSFCTAKVIV